MQNPLTRRRFFQLGMAAGVAARFGKLPAEQGRSAPTRLGFIGVGGRGTYLLKLSLGMQEVEVSAICDINEANLNRAIQIVQEARVQSPLAILRVPPIIGDYCRARTLMRLSSPRPCSSMRRWRLIPFAEKRPSAKSPRLAPLTNAGHWSKPWKKRDGSTCSRKTAATSGPA